MIKNLTPWSPEEDHILREHCANGSSYVCIGAILGRSKGAVAGRVMRLKVVKNRTSTSRGFKNAVNTRMSIRLRAEEAQKPAKPLICEPLDMRRLAFDELRRGVCRFMLGDSYDENHRYCGADTKHGSSWCPHHRKIVYLPPVPRKTPVFKEWFK